MGMMPADKQELLEKWLFEERASCAEAARRLKARFGVKVDEKQVRNFRALVERRRLRERFAASEGLAKEIVASRRKTRGVVPLAVIEMVNQLALEETLKEPGERDLRAVADMVRLIYEGAKQETEVRRLSLAVEQWQFDATKAAMGKLRELRHIHEDDGLSETDKLQEARLLLFGMLPDKPRWKKEVADQPPAPETPIETSGEADKPVTE